MTLDKPHSQLARSQPLNKAHMPSPNSRVILKSFHGTNSTLTGCLPHENYWLLVGESGTVVDGPSLPGRVLVQFDISVSAHGLTCHNPVPNSLYIPVSDLEVADAPSA